MIRRVQMSLNFANKGKLQKLDNVGEEALRVLNLYVEHFWKDPSAKKFDKLPTIPTWLTARLCRCLFVQAFDVLKKLRARKDKAKKASKPVITQKTFDLTECVCTFSSGQISFDFWIKLSSLGNKIVLKIPSKRHKHFLKFSQRGWKLLKASRLRKVNGKWFLDIFFEKDAEHVSGGVSLGLDCGYKKLLTSSDRCVYDVGLERIYAKISRKVQGSKAFRRALTERDQKINQSVNLINFENVREIVVEDLKNIKKNSKGRINKQFNNKLQRWSYPKVLGKLQMVCEEQGIRFLKVPPAYTSQTCSLCGAVDKLSRKGESFCCTTCGMRMDADFNAAINIRQRGVYSPPSVTIPSESI